MVNTYLYSVYGGGASAHVHDPGIEGYRNRWLDAILATSPIEAVIALGGLADRAFSAYRSTPAGTSYAGRYVHVTHPTWPESSTVGQPGALPGATKALLADWNQALPALHPLAHPDSARALAPYGTKWRASEKPPVPTEDLPAGLPPWMGTTSGWATRVRRPTIRITVPAGELP
jgi:hypothetical protein